ncbi:gamma-glutamyl-gamma-aminobutyrate hydrolase family protein [Natranaerobius thermophilus]|uniref:Peptidase C26 n=1 Tax=Natranaerobius thermophilus (strain ATCC BAA-1301 / DSM 18059 / JW/NM-WN-LF) TaxID=457570 RepID=B2A829_NATTJ|nr:gamma-glutamyl-gamma-aminobutyrate hydrolase family protein [Natranaerobius thermophilus]ACB85827.1 peptidase C26 [Natranaerobius thermophilus JW/NM-WN-LF]
MNSNEINSHTNSHSNSNISHVEDRYSLEKKPETISRPIIGVTAFQDTSGDKTRINHSYIRAIEAAGGIPLVIPNPSRDTGQKLLTEVLDQEKPVPGDILDLFENQDRLEALKPGEFSRSYLGKFLDRLDGLVLSGGDDPDPIYFGEEVIPGQGGIEPERDIMELKLTALAMERSLPILGVCRGMQIINVIKGGSNYQDMDSQLQLGKAEEWVKHKQQAPRHYPTHKLYITEGSLLEEIVGRSKIRVNSFHHQAVKSPGEDLVVSGRSGDGIIEAIESKNHTFCLGVQWHPEGHDNSPGGYELFVRLVEESRK